MCGRRETHGVYGVAVPGELVHGKAPWKYRAHYIRVFLSWSWSYVLAYSLRMELGLQFPLRKSEMSQKCCREVSLWMNCLRKDTALDALRFAHSTVSPMMSARLPDHRSVRTSEKQPMGNTTFQLFMYVVKLNGFEEPENCWRCMYNAPMR